MSIVDRINKAIVRVIQRRRGIEVGALHADPTRVELRGERGVLWAACWADIDRAVAVRETGFVGDSILLMVQVNDSVQVLNDDQSGFVEAAAAMASALPGAVDPRDWMLRLLSSPPGERITVYESGRSGR